VNTLFDVKQTVRSLVGDEAASWTGDSYLVPKINFAYRTAVRKIAVASGQNLEQVVQLPNALDANNNPTNQGLGSLAAFQQPGGPLEGLYEPLYVWWKPAGTPDGFYRECTEKQTLPFVQPQILSLGVPVYFTLRQNQLFITPVNAAIDLLVDGRFNVPPLVKDQDVLVAHPFMETAVTPITLGLVGIESGNPQYQETGDQLADDAIEEIKALLILQKQGYTARAGKLVKRGMRGWFWY
jgi:hypothetical protein